MAARRRGFNCEAERVDASDWGDGGTIVKCLGRNARPHRLAVGMQIELKLHTKLDCGRMYIYGWCGVVVCARLAYLLLLSSTRVCLLGIFRRGGVCVRGCCAWIQLSICVITSLVFIYCPTPNTRTHKHTPFDTHTHTHISSGSTTHATLSVCNMYSAKFCKHIVMCRHTDTLYDCVYKITWVVRTTCSCSMELFGFIYIYRYLWYALADNVLMIMRYGLNCY